jgi:hypothetical protein
MARAFPGVSSTFNSGSHENFGAPATKDRSWFLDGRNENGQSIVQRTLGFVENVCGGPTKNNRASFARLAAAKTKNLVLTNVNLKRQYHSKDTCESR